MSVLVPYSKNSALGLRSHPPPLRFLGLTLLEWDKMRTDRPHHQDSTETCRLRRVPARRTLTQPQKVFSCRAAASLRPYFSPPSLIAPVHAGILVLMSCLFPEAFVSKKSILCCSAIRSKTTSHGPFQALQMVATLSTPSVPAKIRRPWRTAVHDFEATRPTPKSAATIRSHATFDHVTPERLRRLVSRRPRSRYIRLNRRASSKSFATSPRRTNPSLPSVTPLNPRRCRFVRGKKCSAYPPSARVTQAGGTYVNLS